MATLTETEAAYDRHQLRVGMLHADVADVIIRLEAERDELLAIVGAETPIAAFDLVTTWRAEKALMEDEITATKAERDAAREALADMVDQYMTAREGHITHEFMSAQEDAIELLETIGWLRAGEYERYYWTPASGRATRAQTEG